MKDGLVLRIKCSQVISDHVGQCCLWMCVSAPFARTGQCLPGTLARVPCSSGRKRCVPKGKAVSLRSLPEGWGKGGMQNLLQNHEPLEAAPPPRP